MQKLIATIFIVSLYSLSIATHAADNEDDTGLYAFIGADFGFGKASEDNAESRSGLHAAVKGLFSYYKPSHIFDLGAGWFYNEMDNDTVTTRTKSAFIEGSFRFRLGKNWSIGPVVMAALANDNSFSTNVKKNGSEFFLGARLEYEPQVFKINKVRLNATLQKDITIDNRGVTLFTVGLQFGFPFSDQKVKVVEKVKVVKKVRVVNKVVYKEKYVPRIVKVSNSRLKATFDRGSGFFFKTGSDLANKRMVSYIERLSYFLKKYNTEWKKIEVSGHTDDVGAMKYNIDLSRRRANRVRSILINNGIDASRIITKAYGPTKPLDKRKTKAARAKNRRVEVEFSGVKSMRSFQEGLSVIQ
jgi:outer membrane protein OmpA-like peptidoglycan-associated protein